MLAFEFALRETRLEDIAETVEEVVRTEDVAALPLGLPM